MADEIRHNVESFLKAKRQYSRLKIPYRRGLLFAGPPGCGKTLTAKVIAACTKATVYLLPLRADLDDDTLSRVFGVAAEDAPSILILEDLDRLPSTGKASVSFLLNLLDGINSPQGVMVIATTNAPEKLDQALLNRPSRFDRVWHFGLPGFDERVRLMRKAGLGRFGEQAIQTAAHQSTGFSMSYVQEIVVSAFLRAINEGRPERDSDLLESASILKTQLRSNFKACGTLRPANIAGFGTDGGS
jgi:SpoVK/Ycf46/Vps4 family AAA+-type ATPase